MSIELGGTRENNSYLEAKLSFRGAWQGFVTSGVA